MVSKTLASLDAWLAEAEKVLAEQRALPVLGAPRHENRGCDGVQLSFFEGEL